MNIKYIYLIVGLVAVLLRFFLNYQTDLIPGLNGGYYPVQIRALINNGHLAFPDMPLLFYLNAFIVKIVSLIAPGCNPDLLIIHVSKIVDSIALPAVLFPLYLIVKNLLATNLSWRYETALVAFMTLSYSPLELSSDFQKNAFALPLMLFFIYYFLMFLKNRSYRAFIVSLIFLAITGFTHFGVFSVCFSFIILGLFIFFKRNAVIPVLIISLLSFFLIGVFDIYRMQRLLFFWQKATDLMMNSRILMYPHGIITYLTTYLLLGLIMLVLIKQKAEIESFNKKILFLFLALIVMLSFPFLKFEYGRRLTLILFVPQTVLLIVIYPYLKPKFKSFLIYFVFLLTAGSLIFHIMNPKRNTIDNEAYEDLKKMNRLIENPNKTIIFTRHGLDWWIAWELRTNVAISYRIPLNIEITEEYEKVLLINQKNGRNIVYPGEQSPFTEPSIPENSILIYNSEYFNLFQLIAD